MGCLGCKVPWETKCDRVRETLPGVATTFPPAEGLPCHCETPATFCCPWPVHMGFSIVCVCRISPIAQGKVETEKDSKMSYTKEINFNVPNHVFQELIRLQIPSLPVNPV